MKYTKKKVTIEASQYQGTEESFHEVCKELGLKINATNAYQTEDMKMVFFSSGSMIIETLEGDMLARSGDFVIKGIKKEVYPCKPDIFRESYSLEDNNNSMDFGQALEKLKQGYKVAREGWNGKNMWLAIQEGTTIDSKKAHGGVAKKLADEGVDKITIAPHIDMKTATGDIAVGWKPSNLDLFAEDWVVVK